MSYGTASTQDRRPTFDHPLLREEPGEHSGRARRRTVAGGAEPRREAGDRGAGTPAPGDSFDPCAHSSWTTRWSLTSSPFCGTKTLPPRSSGNSPRNLSRSSPMRPPGTSAHPPNSAEVANEVEPALPHLYDEAKRCLHRALDRHNAKAPGRSSSIAMGRHPSGRTDAAATFSDDARKECWAPSWLIACWSLISRGAAPPSAWRRRHRSIGARARLWSATPAARLISSRWEAAGTGSESRSLRGFDATTLASRSHRLLGLEWSAEAA